uniref:Protein ENHANCED DISEASE RESISTANCE 2 C-terminal domain-containing protein n=2 Tax=Pseudo-nitzschia delicatissima TaxID=44447 RepID=A0A7S0UJE2_9STRA|mmetsp:Transcript_2953/g.6125  ORF Transcript_2953/g.6125 Transcript_2953/m.6125 type:complete len:372 (+) Transcript_2953:61-1176(+)
MSQQPRRSMGLRASQRDEAILIGSPEPTRSRSAERSSSIASQKSWDCAEGVSQSQSNQTGVSRNRSGGESSIGHSHLQRANSDPFDDGGDELLQVPGHLKEIDGSDRSKALPTLYRFPCTQTRNQNCWSESPVEMFSVRGSNYMSGDKTKVSCKQYLFDARGCDLFLTENCKGVDEITLQGGLGGNLRKKPTYLFRFLFPWGMMIQYYEVPPKLEPFMKMGMTEEEKEKLSILLEGFSNAEKATARWLSSDDQEFKNERLKLIAIVPEGPWVVRNLVTGKPALIGKRLDVSYKYIPRKSNSMECLQICDLDISSGTAIAKKTVNVTRRYMSSLLAVDIGFTIEGQTPEELPEEMMGSIRMHQVDPTQAPSV